jgi:hypothetical protein
MARATLKKYLRKVSERAEKRMAKDPSVHEISTSCMCFTCALARSKVLASSLELKLFEAVEKRVEARRAS